MRLTLLRLLAIGAGIFFFHGNSSAQGFSFNCTRDTMIAGCSPNPCFTLKTILPDIHGLSDSYTINPISQYGSSCFPVYSNPAINGNPTNLIIDDRYSGAISIGFPFPFYGVTYNDLIVSTNGYLSFDISKATQASHWQIVNTAQVPQDLPNIFYDKALIMGPYHDLNPNYPTSPTQHIQYVVVGAAPYRKWILSFYKVPLFTNVGGGCNFFIENTHQIILNESTGIIEVLVFDKQVCPGWNQGRAMVGIQNFNRDQGLMAPGRKASDPPWGTIGMNESWRFVPNGGPSLFRRAELYDLGGTLLAAATTNSPGNGSIEASFPNICPPAGATTSYVVKSFYTKIDDPLVEIFGTDTVRVIKSAASDLNASATSTPSTCGPPTGSITVTVPNASGNYTFLLDGANSFNGPSPHVYSNVGAGTHTVIVTDASGVCNSTVIHVVGQNNNLAANLTSVATSCIGANNGALVVTPTNGTAPYTFLVNPGGLIQTGATATFINLAAGLYTVTVSDAGGCSTSPVLSANVAAGAGLTSNLSAIPTACAGASNGGLVVTPTSGTGPYTFTLNPGNVIQNGATTTTFNNLAAGLYNINIRDANGCIVSPALVAAVNDGAGLNANLSSLPASCPGATNGSIAVTPTNGAGPYTFTLNPGNIVQNGATATTFNNLAGGTYTITIRDVAGCTASPALVAAVATGSGIASNISSATTSCPGINNGTVTVTPTSGTGPYTFTLNPGNVIQTGAANTTFTNLASGNYTVIVRDNNNCTTSSPLSVNVATGAGLNASTSSLPTSCLGSNTGSITIATSNGTGPFTYTLNPGGIVQTNAGGTTFSNLAGGSYTITITDANGCTTSTPLTSTIAQGAGLNAAITSAATACPGVNNGTVTVTPSNGAGPYTFTLNPGNVVQTGATNTTFTNLAPGSYTVTFRDNNNCTASAPLPINVVSGAGLIATANSIPTSCLGSSTGSITIAPSNGTGPFTYTLNPGAIVQTNAGGTTFSNLPGGNYTVSITDANGCTTGAALTTTIAQGAGLNAAINAAPTACPGVNNGSVTVTPSNGTGPYTFTLNPGNVIQTGATTTTFSNLAVGVYTVTISDAIGCVMSGTLTASVTSGAGVLSATAQTATSCIGATNGTATITPTNGSSPFTFVLDGTITQTGTTSTTFNNLVPGAHSVTITDNLGCTSNPPVTITIAAGPALTTTASHTNVLCNGASNGSITVVQPAIGIAPYQYSLDGVVWQSSNIFNGLIAATYTVYFRESNGCQGQLTQVVTQPAILTATRAVVPVICNGQSNGTITVTASGGTTPYEYSINGGTTWQTSNIFTVAIGSYTINIRDANLCTMAPLTATVTQPPVLTATGTTSNATCNGGADGHITVIATGGNATYEYSSDGTTFQSSNILNVIAGTYTVTVRDNLGCTTTVPNMIVGLTNDLTYAAPAPSTICEGKSTQLQVTSNALQYSWLPATGLSNAGIANPVASPVVTTNYLVTVTFGNCTANVPVTVNVNAAPIPDAGINGFICYGQTYLLQGSGGTSYKWTPSTYLDNATVFNPTATPDKTITYSLSVSDANGCNSLITDDIVVDVTPPIKVSTFPYDTVASSGDQFQVLATSVATDYIWTPSTGLSNPAIANPVVTAGAVGDLVLYKVTASTQAGCKGEGFVRVQVYQGPELYVPTGFTPNGDGKNDKFFPFPVGIKEIKYFRVFTRWGQMIYSTSKVNDGWDGKYAGREQASGVYVWTVEGITKDNKVITKRGTIMLIR